jgi:hypothetical protein
VRRERENVKERNGERDRREGENDRKGEKLYRERVKTQKIRHGE